MVDLGRNLGFPAACSKEVLGKTEKYWLSSRDYSELRREAVRIISSAVDFHMRCPGESQPSPRMLRPVPWRMVTIRSASSLSHSSRRSSGQFTISFSIFVSSPSPK